MHRHFRLRPDDERDQHILFTMALFVKKCNYPFIDICKAGLKQLIAYAIDSARNNFAPKTVDCACNNHAY